MAYNDYKEEAQTGIRIPFDYSTRLTEVDMDPINDAKEGTTALPEADKFAMDIIEGRSRRNFKARALVADMLG